MSVIGPAAAAVFVSTIGWAGVFWINVPFGICALILGHRSLPTRTADGEPRRTDLIGLALALGFIVSMIAALSTLSVRTAIFGVVAVAAGLVWWFQAGRTEQPLLHRQHVAANPYRLIGLTIGFGLAAAVALNLYLPIVIRGSLGLSESVAAFSLLVFSLAWTIGAQITSRLLDHYPGPTVAIGGFVVLLVGTIAGMLLGPSPSFAGLAITAAIRGLGIRTISIPYLTELQKHAEGSEFGRINAAHQFFRFIGFNVSIALVGTIVFAVVDFQTEDVEGLRGLLAGDDVVIGSALGSSLGSGYQWAHGVMTVIAAMGLGFAILTRRWLREHPLAKL